MLKNYLHFVLNAHPIHAVAVASKNWK